MGADRITDMPWRVGFAVSLALAGLLLGAAGCAPLVDMPPPSLDGPRISNIRFNPQEGRVGCPFDIVVQVDTVHGTPTQMRAAWTRAYGRRGSLGEAVLPVESGSCARDADTDVTVRIVPQQSGVYYYRVQIEDEQGRRSNVLDGTRHVPRQWFESTCRDSP